MQRGGMAAPGAGLRAGAAVALLLSALLPAALAAPSASVLQAEFSGVRLNGDGLYEALEVAVQILPPAAGTYSLSATLLWPAGSTVIAAMSGAPILPQNLSRFTFEVPGATVSEKQLDGPYELLVEFSGGPSAVHESASFTSPPFRADDFVAAAPGARPRVQVSPPFVDITAPAVHVSVRMDAPSLTWWPKAPADNGSTLTFLGAFLLPDDFFPTPTVTFPCGARFDEAAWNLSSLVVGPTPELGSIVQVVVSAPIAFVCSGSTLATGNASVSVLVAERNGTAPGALPIPLAGGAELLVSVHLEWDRPLAAPWLGLWVDLEAAGKRPVFIVPSAAGQELLDPWNGAVIPGGYFPPQLGESSGPVKVVNESGAVLEALAWRTLAPQTLASGQGRFAEVNASRWIDGKTLHLFLSAPLDFEVRQVTVNQVGSAVNNAVPPPLGKAPPAPAGLPPSALIFVAALGAAAAMFFFSVYARAKKY